MKTRKHEMAQFYREQVQKIENEIFAITNNATDIQFSDEKGAYLVALITERKDIMDAMFVDAVKDTKHIEQVNDMLYNLSRKMYDGVITMYDKAKKTLFKNAPMQISRWKATCDLQRMRRMLYEHCPRMNTMALTSPKCF